MHPAKDHFSAVASSQTVDLRGQIVPVKVSADCGYAPVPSLPVRRLGPRARDGTVSALAFPGSPGGGGTAASATSRNAR
jgi:hypothetical protein